MGAVLSSLLLPFGQLLDRGFVWPLVKGLVGGVLAFFGLALLAGWAVEAVAGGTGHWAVMAAMIGGGIVVVSAIWLYVPVAIALAGLFANETSAAVERRHYPALPPAVGASLAAQARFNVLLALRVLAITLVVLPLALVAAPVGAVLFWLVAAISLGHGLFEGVAQRRMSVPQARALRRRREAPALAVGAVMATLALVPLLNLLVPILGTAAMTHLLHRGRGGPVADGTSIAA